jgi:hypothetical protein
MRNLVRIVTIALAFSLASYFGDSPAGVFFVIFGVGIVAWIVNESSILRW